MKLKMVKQTLLFSRVCYLKTNEKALHDARLSLIQSFDYSGFLRSSFKQFNKFVIYEDTSAMLTNNNFLSLS